jgi:hypothetical protein
LSLGEARFGAPRLKPFTFMLIGPVYVDLLLVEPFLQALLLCLATWLWEPRRKKGHNPNRRRS